MKSRLFIRPWIVTATAFMLVGGVLFLGEQSFKAMENVAFNEFNRRQVFLASNASDAIEFQFQTMAARELIQKAYLKQSLLIGLVIFIILFCFSYILVIFSRMRRILEREVESKTHELKVSHERLVTILDSLDALVFVVDMKTGEVFFANKYVVSIFGEVKGESCLEKLQQAQSEVCDFCFSKEELLIPDGEFKGVRVREMRSRVNDRWYETHASTIHWVDGKRVRLVIATDVTDRRKSEEELRKLSQVVEQSPVSIIITDLDGIAEYVNPKFVEVSGYSMKEVVGKKTSILRSGHTSERVYKELWKTIKSGKEWRREIQNRKKDGQLFWEDVLISPIKGSNGKITHFLAIKEDITMKKEYEKHLIQKINFDYLTDLPNRTLVFDRLSQAITGASRKDREVVVMLIDLDQFKIVNDTLGHAAGDKLLMEAAGRLTSSIRKSDTVARLSGDEFLVILPDLTAATHSAVVAQKILEAFSRPFFIDGREVFVTASIGLTVYPSDGENPDILLRNADAAMYRAKKESRNTFRFFTLEMDDRAIERMEMETHLRYALDKGTLEVQYQPFIDVKSGKLVGAEALLRWNDPAIAPVTPDQFIPLAEETGLIIPIGEWVLNEVCAQAKIWQEQAGLSLRVAVNISSRQFKSNDLVGTVARALKTSNLSPEYLELEITERLLMEDAIKTKETLNKLHEMGLRLSVDDFGTGYSALSYLKNFSFDTLKVDRSFVRDVTVDPEDAALTKAIIGMAHSLGLMVIGEGVETEEQLKFLDSEGCDWVQGFYFSKALPPKKFQEYVQQYISENKDSS